MERKLRRQDRAVPEAEARELLQRGEYGVLATAGPDGQPYAVPLNYSCEDDAIYFHCAVEGRKLDYLAANDRVSFCVVGATEVQPDKFATKYESVMVSGRAREVTGDEKQKGLVSLLKKYSFGSLQEGEAYIRKAGDKTRVYKIPIESISGKARR